MQFKIIGLLIVGLILSTSIKAMEDERDHLFIIMTSGQQELEALKEFHHYNEIFDNYHVGGTSPDVTIRKGRQP